MEAAQGTCPYSTALLGDTAVAWVLDWDKTDSAHSAGANCEAMLAKRMPEQIRVRMFVLSATPAAASRPRSEASFPPREPALPSRCGRG